MLQWLPQFSSTVLEHPGKTPCPGLLPSWDGASFALCSSAPWWWGVDELPCVYGCGWWALKSAWVVVLEELRVIVCGVVLGGQTLAAVAGQSNLLKNGSAGLPSLCSPPLRCCSSCSMMASTPLQTSLMLLCCSFCSTFLTMTGSGLTIKLNLQNAHWQDM